MRNSKRIHPAGGNINHPGAQIFIPRILLLNKNHRHGRFRYFTRLCKIWLGTARSSGTLPPSTIHRVRLGVTHPSPKILIAPLLGALIPWAVIHTRTGAIRPQRTHFQSCSRTLQFNLNPLRPLGVTFPWPYRTMPKPTPIHTAKNPGSIFPWGTRNNISLHIRRCGDGRRVHVVIGKHYKAQAQLLLVIQTIGTQRLALGLGQGRQKHACQDRNDGNHNQ